MLHSPARLCIAALIALSVVGCAGRGASTARAPSAAEKREPSPAAVLEQAERALESEEAARAVALFGRFLAVADADGPGAQQAMVGLGRAHELLGDCAAAVRAYDAYLDRFGDAEDQLEVYGRRGACEAELGRWERSASSYRRIAQADGLLPSASIEALARQGYALFSLERYDEATAVLEQADKVFVRAERKQTERFSTYYFVGMARFYRAAIIHRRFRDVSIELPEKVMEAALKRKLELLVSAQDAYYHAIRAKHMFWVSASGYQLGHMFGEFYDELMYAPVPQWLDERQRRIYYQELKKQLRPVVDKAVFVLEKNLETARRLGYESPFVDQTHAKLGHLQKVMLSTDAGLGEPHPALAREAADRVAPRSTSDQAQPPEDRKLFVPDPTPL